MSETNGHGVTDLGEILEQTRPARTLRIPIDALTGNELTPYELVAVGRAVGMSPSELGALSSSPGGEWASIELMQAIAWVIVRRVEPDLSWEEAQRFRVEPIGKPPNPTPHAVAKSRRRRGVSSS